MSFILGLLTGIAIGTMQFSPLGVIGLLVASIIFSITSICLGIKILKGVGKI